MKLQRDAILVVLGVLLLGLGGWWWLATMKQVSKAVPDVTDEARKHPMLAASRWLNEHGWPTQEVTTLDLALPLRQQAGVMLIVRRDGFIPSESGASLLRWVAAGGMLIMPARKLPTGQKAQDDVEGRDAIEQLLQTGLVYSQGRRPDTQHLTFPDGAYPLKIDSSGPALIAYDDAPDFDWQDEGGNVWMYRLGEGRIVLLNDVTRFDNHSLSQFDHAELLLQLLRWQDRRGTVLLVQGLRMPPWYLALWQHFPHVWVALAVLVLLGLWRAIPRWGPVLPEPATERRAVIEHIDASGRWLWQSAAGRQRLIQAMRQSALAQIERRAPGLLRLDRAALWHRLARQAGVSQQQAAEAMHGQPAQQPVDFARQIRILQTLRNAHEHRNQHRP